MLCLSPFLYIICFYLTHRHLALFFFFFSSRRRHTRLQGDWSSDVCSSDLFIIMLTLPLSVPFALLSLWITGRALSLWSALGMFLLLGIVKKNGILQVDYTNRLRAAGTPTREAILEANRVRLRPILMTTLSIVAGLIPVAIGIGAGSEQRASIAVTIIGGQTLCLLLTLLVVPVAYSYLAELEAIPWRDFPARIFTRTRSSVSTHDSD